MSITVSSKAFDVLFDPRLRYRVFANDTEERISACNAFGRPSILNLWRLLPTMLWLQGGNRSQCSGTYAQPLDAGGLEADVGVKAASHGPVDDGLLFLLQQCDEPPLDADVPLDRAGPRNLGTARWRAAQGRGGRGNHRYLSWPL